MKKRKVIFSIVAVILILVICCYAIPQLRVNLFIRCYHELIEENLNANNGVPADDALYFGYKYVNSWPGEHHMTEFLIMTRGNTYIGCYNSQSMMLDCTRKVPPICWSAGEWATA